MARVLVVDDERGIRNTLREFLRSSGHEVLLAADVDEGRKLLEAHAVDVVVLDVVLPRDVMELIAYEGPKDHQSLAGLMENVPWRLEKFGADIAKLLKIQAA